MNEDRKARMQNKKQINLLIKKLKKLSRGERERYKSMLAHGASLFEVDSLLPTLPRLSPIPEERELGSVLMTEYPHSPSTLEEVEQQITQLFQQKIMSFSERVDKIVPIPDTSRGAVSLDLESIEEEIEQLEFNGDECLCTYVTESIEEVGNAPLVDGKTVSDYLERAQMEEIFENGYQREILEAGYAILSSLRPTTELLDDPLPLEKRASGSALKRERPSSLPPLLEKEIMPLFQQKIALFTEDLRKIVQLPRASTSPPLVSTDLTQMQKEITLLEYKNALCLQLYIHEKIKEVGNFILPNGKTVFYYRTYDDIAEVLDSGYQRALFFANNTMLSHAQEEAAKRKNEGSRPLPKRRPAPS